MLGITGPLSGWLSDRFGFHFFTVLGLAILAFSYFNLAQLSILTTRQEFVFAYLPIGIGMGMFQSPNNSSHHGECIRKTIGCSIRFAGNYPNAWPNQWNCDNGSFMDCIGFSTVGISPGGATSATGGLSGERAALCLHSSRGDSLAGTALSIFAWILERKKQ